MYTISVVEILVHGAKSVPYVVQNFGTAQNVH